MSYYNQPYSLLFVVKNPKDSERISEAIAKEKLGCLKIGESTYLGFFFDVPAEIYSQWKKEFGIEGEVHWIQLPHSEITK